MKLFKQGELKLLWPFYLSSLISPMLFFMPAFFVVYFRDLGLSLFQISILTMMMPLFMILFEIPTGAIADIYGRKFSVLLGIFIEGLAIFSIFFLNNFYFLMGAFALAGFGGTFASGAKEAWTTDLIKKEKKDFLHGYFSKRESINGFGLFLSGIIGALIVKQFGVSLIWIFAGISFFITFLILSFAKEHFVKRKNSTKDSFKNIHKQSIVSINYARNHPVLFLFLVASAIGVFAGVFNSDLAWITLLQELNFPDYAFGYMWSAMGSIMIFAPLISLKLLKKGKEKKFIAISIFLTLSFLTLILFVKSVAFALLVLFSSIFFAGLSSPVERTYFHKFIKNKLRATVGSVESMLIATIGILALPLAGLSVDYLGPRYTILLSALLMIPYLIIFLRIKEPKTL